MSEFDQKAVAYVRRVLHERGLTATDLASLAGLSQTTVTRPLNEKEGKYRITEKTIRKIADATGIAFEGIFSNNEHHSDILARDILPRDTLPKPNARPAYSSGAQRDGTDLGPIYASAQGGNGEQTIATGEIVEHRPKPQRWTSVKGLYGFYVVGDSMAPRINAGEMVWVHPHRKPAPGQEAVFIKKADDNGADIMVMVKLFTAQSAAKWIVKQHNPKREFELKKSEWDCQLIVDIDLNR